MQSHKKTLFLFLVIVVSLFNVHSLLAQDVDAIEVSTLVKRQTTGDNYYYLKDNSQNLTLNDVRNSDLWKPTEPGITNRGFTKAASWMKFSLSNSSNKNLDIVLEYVDPAVQSIDVYHRPTGSQKNFENLNFTFNKPVKDRPIAFFRPAFPLDVNAQSGSEVFVRILPGDSFPMHSFTSLRIWEESTFHRTGDKELVLMLILLCTEFLMGVATIALYALLKEKIFLYYAFFVFSATALFAVFSGIWSYLFVPGGGFELPRIVLQVGICYMATFLFVRKFLQTEKHMPKADILLQAIIILNLIGVILNLAGHPHFSRIIIDYTAIGYLILIPIGISAHKRKIPHALLFTFSWIVIIAGMFFASVRLRGYISDSFMAQNLLYFGGFAEISLLATIMVLTVHSLQKERNAFEKNYRRTLEESADKLALKVNQQTELLKQAKEKAENEARIDILTGINNRRAFLETADQYINRAKRSNDTKLFLALIDIDHFKNINDTYGHSAGDLVLQSTARSLQETIRKVDTVFRIGGEEFAILMQSTDHNGIVKLCERIRTTVENLSSKFNQEQISVTISIGLAEYANDCSLDELLQQSDKALYLAKIQGRNQLVLFN